MAIAGAVGWFRQVLPHEVHEMLPVTDEEIAIEREGRRVTHVEHAASGRGVTASVDTIRSRPASRVASRAAR